MKLIVALGNPGKEYEMTRHNAGFLALDFLQDEWIKDGRFTKERSKTIKEFSAVEGTYLMDDITEKLVFLKPLLFMNKSGIALKKYLFYHKKIDVTQDLWVLHDELDVVFGNVKINYAR